MRTVLLDQVIDTDYGQFDLVRAREGGFDGDWDQVFAGQANGLAGAANPHGLYLNIAGRSGGGTLRIELLDEEPETSHDWEDVVEVSITVPPGADVQWATWAWENTGRLELPAGSFRVRVSARGRDAADEDALAAESPDSYLVEMWRAPWTNDAIVAVGSANARSWHAEVGSRR